MLKVVLLIGGLSVALVPTLDSMVDTVTETGCEDSATAADRLGHVLPMFADTIAAAVQWRANGGMAQTSWHDAEVVSDRALCGRIDAQVRTWHAQAADTTQFGDYKVYALRIAGYYAAVVDYPPPSGYDESTRWSTLLVLAPDDLRVLRVTLV